MPDLFKQSEQILDLLVDDGRDDRLFILEIVIDVADAHTGSLRNHGHAGTVKSVAPDTGGGGGENLLAPCLAAICIGPSRATYARIIHHSLLSCRRDIIDCVLFRYGNA